MREDSMLADVKELQAAVNRLQPLETPAPGKGLWVDRPTAPVQDQQYFATDATRRIQYFWDVTANNWLSTQLFPVAITPRPDNTLVANSLTTTRNNVLIGTHPDNTSSIFITTIVTNIFVNAINSATNFWTVSFRTRDVSAATTNTYSGDTKLATTASRLFPITIAVNAVVTKASFYDIAADFTITLAPGGISFDPATLWCRLVG